MWRVLKIPFKERFPSLKSIITSTLGWTGMENPHLRNSNIGEDDDSSTSSLIKSLEKEIEKVRSEMKILKGEDTDVLPTLAYSRQAYKIFDQILQSKIESDGGEFLRIDSKPWDIIVKLKLDMEELKQNYPLVQEDEYIRIIDGRIFLLRKCNDIETCYKLIVFFAENEYEHCLRISEELLLADRAELEKIHCGISTALGDPHHLHMDPLLDSAINRYRQICVGSCDKAKAKEERLSLVRDDRGKSLYYAKKAKNSKEEILSLAKINRDQSLFEAEERYKNIAFLHFNRL